MQWTVIFFCKIKDKKQMKVKMKIHSLHETYYWSIICFLNLTASADAIIVQRWWEQAGCKTNSNCNQANDI